MSGALWSTAANAARFSANILILPILARYLTPHDFGLVQLGAPLIFFFMAMSELGINPALVRKDHVSHALWSTTLWTNMMAAALFAGILIALAPAIGSFYREPDAVPILIALCSILVLQSVSSMPYAWHRRAMNFRWLAIIEVTSNIFSAVVAIVTAAYNAGAWAIVYQQLTLYVTKAVFCWSTSRPPLRLTFSLQELRSVFGFGMNVTGAYVVELAANQVITMLLGRYLGVAQVGLYSLGYRLTVLPSLFFSRGLAGTFLPALGKIQNEPYQHRHASLRILRLSSFGAFPAFAGICALADPVANLFFGANMAGVAPVVQALAPTAAIVTLANFYGTILMSLGKSAAFLKFAALTQFLSVAGVAIGLNWGLVGAVQGLLIANAIAIVPGTYVVAQMLEIRTSNLLAAMIPNALSAFAMGLVVYGFQLELDAQGVSSAVQLFICVPTGAAVYAIASILIEKRSLIEAVQLIAQRRAR